MFLREHKNGMYRTDVYFLCKTLAELPLFTFIPVLFTSICYFLIGLNHEDAKFFIAIGIVVLVANVATSFGEEETNTSVGSQRCFNLSFQGT